MTDKEFRALVAAMRDRQKEYFRTRTHEALTGSKRLEKLVDEELWDQTELGFGIND